MKIKNRLSICLLTFFFFWGVANSVIAQDVKLPYSDGLHKWSLDDGELILMSAIYTNQTSYDLRAYTFYYQLRGKKSTYIVPFIESGKRNIFTFVTSSGGDWLLSDLLVKKIGNKVFLTKAQQASPDGYSSPGDLTLERYELKRSDIETPYYFELVSKKIMPHADRVSVDDLLKSELNTPQVSNKK